jgi:hypothetical protein
VNPGFVLVSGIQLSDSLAVVNERIIANPLSEGD